ncbi:MAG TPA: class I SAM-dependent methyltransferase [Candidatus Saccharimonadales bacterium]
MSGVWAEKHKGKYAASDWIDKPSIFAEAVVRYFPSTGKVLELGAGQGQDGRFFAQQGYEVTSTDLEQTALDISKQKQSVELRSKITLQQVDLGKKLPFADASFHAVYAHLSLHYFDTDTTKQIFNEIRRVLKPGGVLAFLVNSTNDPEYGIGKQLEMDYFQTDGMPKRYFSVRTAGGFTAGFTVKLLDDQGETYKDMAKGVHNLIRFIGIKPE